MTEFVGGVLWVGDLGTDFLVVLPPRPFLTHFGLVSRGVGWRSWDGERVFTYTVDNDNCPRSGEAVMYHDETVSPALNYSFATSAVLHVTPSEHLVAEGASYRHDIRTRGGGCSSVREGPGAWLCQVEVPS